MSTLTPERPSAASGTNCPNCKKPDYAANGWCRFCGYYGVLGKCVELADWERDFVDGEYTADEVEVADHPWIAAIKAVPNWAWYLGGVLCLVTLLNLAVRLSTIPGSAYRIVAAVGLLAIGFVVTFGTHVYAGIRNLFEDPHSSLSDIAIHPLQLWCSVCLQLPYTVRRVALLWGGVWMMILVHLVVGVPYLQLVDLSEGPKKPPSVAMTPGEIASAVAAASSEEYLTLEDALGEIASDWGDDDTAKSEADSLSLKDALGQLMNDLDDDSAIAPGDPLDQEQTAEADSEFVTVTLGAVVIGYTGDGDTITSLVLAVMSQGNWRVAGTVSSGFTAETLEKLNSQLSPIQRERPFVQTELSAKWVEPTLRVRIEAEYSKTEDRFGQLTFLELL